MVAPDVWGSMTGDDLARRSRDSHLRLEAIERMLNKELERSQEFTNWLEKNTERLENAQAEEDKHRITEEILEKAIEHDKGGIDVFEVLDEERKALVESDLIRQESNVEEAKLRAEVLKHQSTISGAAVLGVAAISRLLPEPLTLEWLLWISYVLLLWTVGSSLTLMHLESLRAGYMLRSGLHEPSNVSTAVVYLASMAGLPIAFVVFIVFVIVNANY